MSFNSIKKSLLNDILFKTFRDYKKKPIKNKQSVLTYCQPSYFSLTGLYKTYFYNVNVDNNKDFFRPRVLPYLSVKFNYLRIKNSQLKQWATPLCHNV